MPRERATHDVLLTVEELSVAYASHRGDVRVVDDVSFELARGETLGLVGESGSGKSVTAWSLLKLVVPPGRITSGRVRFDGRDLLQLPEPELRAVRGAGIGLVFQEPLSALNPVMRVGDQIAEALVVHRLEGWSRARARAVELLDAVRLPDAPRRARAYPHQLSGGMRQRVMLAIALACAPTLLIADEPTTSLDVTIQAEILDLLRDLRAERDLSMILISHDMGVIAQMADRVVVMHRGQLVEQGPVRRVLRQPVHPYTRSLIAALAEGPRGATA